MNRYHITAFLIMLLAIPVWAIDVFQSDIPLSITSSGTYVLQENVSYKGHHSAIKIKANNVTIDLNGFSISVSKRKANAILVKNISNFTIQNGSIIDISKKQWANNINIMNANQGSIQNISTMGNRNGLSIAQSNNIQVQNSNFSQAMQAAALVTDSTNITFDNDTFADSNNGLKVSGANENINVTNSSFPTAMFSNLLVQQVNGMTVENSTFGNQGGDPAKANLVQFGDANPAQVANNVIFNNNTIINRPALGGNTAPEGLGIYQGSGFIVDSNMIDIDNTGQDPAADLSGIHISNPGLGVNGTTASNVIVRNSVIQGPATDGIYPDVGSSGIVLENNLVSGALKDGIFLAGTTASTVVGNTAINNGTNGIFLGEVSSSNMVSNNVVSGNGFNPITASIPPVGNGIGIAADSSMNTIQGNTISNNAAFGIDNLGTSNQILNNTASSNGSGNFHTATGTIVTSTAGTSTLTGANISA